MTKVTVTITVDIEVQLRKLIAENNGFFFFRSDLTDISNSRSFKNMDTDGSLIMYFSVCYIMEVPLPISQNFLIFSLNT